MVIIVGGTHHNTLSMVRSYGEAGYSVDLILTDGREDSYVLKSKYINSSYVVKSDEEALSYIKDNYETGYIISCSDGIAMTLDLHYNELKSRFSFFNCGEQGRLSSYMDKMTQTEIAKNIGFMVPYSQVYYSGETPNSTVVYPCIVKPLASVYGGKKIRICNTPAELEVAMDEFKDSAQILVQEYLNREEEIVIAGVGLSKNAIIPGYIQKIRDVLGGTTYSRVMLLSTLPNAIVDNIKKFINFIDYEGLFGIELIKSRGKYFFIEINLRNDATTYSFVKAGCNLPLLYVKNKEHKKIEQSEYNITPINSIVELNDVAFTLKGKVSIIKWIREYSQCECKYFKDNKDVKPYYIALRMFVLSSIKKVIRKIIFK